MSSRHDGSMVEGAGLGRRGFLQAGGLGLLGLTLADLRRVEAGSEVSAARPTARSCILLYCYGGPAHQDIWDLKPEAPQDIRGQFKPISTAVPGLEISEHLPRLARQADKFSIVRSVHHELTQHNPATLFALTGHPPTTDVPELSAQPGDPPAFGSVLARLSRVGGLAPPFVSAPARLIDGVYPTPGQTGGRIGRQYDPLFVESDPNLAEFDVPGISPLADVSDERVAGRRRLLEMLGRSFSARERGAGGTTDAFQEQAFSLIASPAARQAFDLSLEPDWMRDEYGRNTWGQCAVLARRLVEAGSRMVTIHWSPDFDRNWDTHGGNFKLLKDMLLPQLDQALSALLWDLDQRGRLGETLVVCMGEFGRTPRINGAAGRDHWPGCYSVMLAGGGVAGGGVVGRSDKEAAFPVERPVSPRDVAATIFSALGVPPDAELHDILGRPHRLVDGGSSIQELFTG